MRKTALILIDIQNDYFPGGKWEVEGMTEAAENAARLLRDARHKGQAIIHVRHEIPGTGAPFFLSGSEGAQIHASVAAAKDETVLLKHHPNSFHKTPLHALLQKAGITDLTVCGAMSQMCIDTTVRAAADLGYGVALAHDACAARALSFGGIDVPAAQVQAAYMAALDGLFAKVLATRSLLG